jgi:hypothetical protein
MSLNIKAAVAAAVSVAVAGAFAPPTLAQVGQVFSTPIPDGLKAGTGAPFPKGHYAALDKLPDWGGIWLMTFDRPPGSGGPPRPAPPPPLKGKYLDQYNAWKANIKANSGVVKSTTSHCTPPGMPAIMSMFQYPYEFLFTPGRVTINQEAWMQTRHIWTDGRPHAQDPDPTFMGDSVGHWEGDTLVADTIAIKDTVPLATGAPHSDKLHVMERIHLKKGDPNILIDEVTVEDPEALEHPYTTSVTYRRDRYGALLEFECAENDRNPVDEKGDTSFEQ